MPWVDEVCRVWWRKTDSCLLNKPAIQMNMVHFQTPITILLDHDLPRIFGNMAFGIRRADPVYMTNPSSIDELEWCPLLDPVIGFFASLE
jgi:hypothetical protein